MNDHFPTQPDEPITLPPSVRFLKWLVIALMITMMGGVITIVGLLVTRLPEKIVPFQLPEQIELPNGAHALAITFHPDWIAVVTQAGDILIFTHGGTLKQTITPAS